MKKILIIDDEEIIHESIEMVLDEEDYVIINARNGNEGLELLHKHSPHVIFLDLRMPELDGESFLKKIYKNVKDTPKIFVLTGHGSKEEKERLQLLGIEEFIEKPFDINEIRSLIQSCFS